MAFSKAAPPSSPSGSSAKEDRERDLHRRIAAFEAARIARPLHLEPTPVGRILAVHDGRGRDPAVTALAEAAAARTGAEVETLAVGESAPHEAILKSAARAQLMFMPCRFRAGDGELSSLGLSTTVELVLDRGSTPICLVRGPVADPGECLSDPVVALGIHPDREVDATCLALALARDRTVALLCAMDPTARVRQEMIGRDLDPRDLGPEVLEGLATRGTGALVAALQKVAHEWAVTPRVQLIVGDGVQRAIDVARGRGGLLVAGFERNGTLPDARRARELVLGSALPVLLV